MAQKHDILYVNFYTDGSAARKLAPAFPEVQPRRKPKTVRQQKRVLYLDPVAVLSLVVAAALLVMMAIGLTQFQKARSEAQQMEEYVQQLAAEKEALEAEYHESINLEEVEKTARALGMVDKDQVPAHQIHVDGQD